MQLVRFGGSDFSFCLLHLFVLRKNLNFSCISLETNKTEILPHCTVQCGKISLNLHYILYIALKTFDCVSPFGRFLSFQNLSPRLYRSKCNGIWKTLPPVEWFPEQSQHRFQKSQRRQWLQWCHLGLWRWYAGWSAQGCSGRIKSSVPKFASTEQTQSSTDLHERDEISWSTGYCRFPLLWRS